MGQKTKELTPCQRYIAMITLVGLIFYSIYNAVLVVKAYGDFSQNVGELKDLVSNWESTTILDIKMMTTCPTGYSSALTDRNWPGVDEGCYCGTVSATTLKNNNITCTPFCKGSCSTKASSLGCKTIAGQNPQALNNWIRKSGSNYQPCIKRSTETFAKTASLTTSSGTCPTGYLKCGTTAENVFCTKESQCPISYIEIKSIDSSMTSTCVTGNNCQVISEPDVQLKVKTLSYKRADTYDGLPLTEFTVNENGMCDIKNERDITPGRAQYYLLKSKPSSCKGEGTNRWTTLDTTTEADLFTANGNIMGNNLYYYVKTTLATYSQPSAGLTGYYPTGRDGTNYNWKMFGRDYIPWKISCREKMETFIDKSQNVNRLKSAQLALLIIGMTSTVALGLVLSFMEFQNLRGVDLPCIPGKGEEERKRIKKIKKILNYTFKLGQLPFQVWAIALCVTTKGLFDNLVNDACSSDVDTTVLIATLSTKLKTAYQNNIIAIALLAASLLLDLILMAFEKKEEKNLPAIQTNRESYSPDQASQSAMNLNNSVFNNTYGDVLNTQGAGIPTNSPNIVINLQPQPQPQALLNPMPAQPQMIPQAQYPQGQYPVQPQMMQPSPYPQPQFMAQQQYPQAQFAQQQFPQAQFAEQQYPMQYNQPYVGGMQPQYAQQYPPPM